MNMQTELQPIARDWSRDWRIEQVHFIFGGYALFVGGQEYQAGECYDCGAELIRYEADADYEGEERGFVDCSIRRCVACGSKDCESDTASKAEDVVKAIARTLFPEPHHSVDPIAQLAGAS